MRCPRPRRRQRPAPLFLAAAYCMRLDATPVGPHTQRFCCTCTRSAPSTPARHPSHCARPWIARARPWQALRRPASQPLAPLCLPRCLTTVLHCQALPRLARSCPPAHYLLAESFYMPRSLCSYVCAPELTLPRDGQIKPLRFFLHSAWSKCRCSQSRSRPPPRRTPPGLMKTSHALFLLLCRH